MDEERQLNEDIAGELSRLRARIRELERERGSMQETLKDSEERLRLIYDNSPIGMGFVNLEGVLVDCNEALGSILGSPPRKLIGFPMRTGLTNEAVAVALARAFSGKTGAFEGDYTSVLSGKQTVLRALFSPLFSPAGKQKGVLFIAEDISERKAVEDALRTSENRYKAIVESQAEFVVRYLPGGILSYVNDTLCRYLNMKREDLLGRSYYPFMHADDRDAFIRKIELLDRKGPVMVAEARVVLPDGSVTWHRWPHHAIFDNAGKLVEYQSTGRDVTELKRAEDEVAERGAMLRQIMDTASVAIFLVDKQGRITHANRRMAEMFLVPLEQLVGGEYVDLVHPAERERGREKMLALLNSRIPSVDLERRYRRTDGAEFWGHLVGRRFHDTRGADIGLIGVISDITEYRRSEEALKENEARYRRLYNETPVLMHSIDRNGIVVEVNDHWLKTMGYERREVMGRKVTDFYTEASRTYALEVIQPAFFRDGQVKDAAYQFVRKNGEIIDVLLSATGERDGTGQVVRSQAVIQDVTERKRAEREIDKYSDDLRRLLAISREMTATTDVTRLYHTAVQTAADLLRFDFSTIMTLSTDRAGLTIADAVGFPRAMIGAFSLVEGQGLSTYVVRNKRPEAVPDFTKEERFEVPAVVRERNIRSALCVPMMLGDEVFGVLIGHTLEQRTFTAEETALYQSIGNQAAIAIRNAMSLQALGKSEKMLQAIIDAEPECVKVLDENACLIMMNRAGLDMLQADSLEQVRGQCVCPLVTSEYRPAFLDLTKRVFQGGSGTLEFEIVGMKGRRLWLETHAVPLRNEKNEITAVLGVTRDVTERKRAEDALRRSEARFRSIIEQASSGILVADAETKGILYANPEICRMLGYTEQEFLSLTALDLVVPEEKQGSDQGFRAHAEGTLHTTERTMKRKDGSPVRMSISSVFIEFDGRPSLAGFFSDISERRLLEEERLKTQKLESIGTLAGGIAHDFNNLLQGVFGYISMAKMTFDDRPRAFSMLEQAEKALHLSVNLTTQLLTFSKGGTPVKKKLNIGPVIESAVKFSLSGSRASHQLQFDEDLAMVDADEGQLSQVIQNIVLNADQSMPLGGTIEVSARNVPADDPTLPQGLHPGDFVAVAVRDSGIGIPEQFLSRIFDPYFTTKEKGSGLGLATSYSIVKNHGGVIDVRSETGKGSVFTIYLPASLSGESSSPVPTAAPDAVRRGRILVMDDEEIVRMVSGELIRSMGHEVEFAEHGKAAIEKYRQALDAGMPYDIVILDLTIRGGMGGLETLKKLREIDPGVQAVVSSGYSDDSAIADFEAHGFRAFLQKPYDLESLQDVLSRLMQS